MGKLRSFSWEYCRLFHEKTAHFFMEKLQTFPWEYCTLFHGNTAHILLARKVYLEKSHATVYISNDTNCGHFSCESRAALYSQNIAPVIGTNCVPDSYN